MYGLNWDNEAKPKFKVGDRVRSKSVHDASVGIVGGYHGDGVVIINYKDPWVGRCHEIESQIIPAFLPGDRVRVTRHSGYFGCGDTGEVDNQSGTTVFVKHGAYQRIGLPIDADALELIADPDAGNKWTPETITGGPLPAAPQPCIVAITKNGQPLPATRPYVHASADAALLEAERLAKNNPGQEFAVYRRVAGRVAEVSYSMKEVA